MVQSGQLAPKPDVLPPSVPMDYDWARVNDTQRMNQRHSCCFFSSLVQELGLIRKPASFMTSIVDDRGQELLYAGMPITDVIKEDMGIGGVLSLLWFRKRFVIIQLKSIINHSEWFVLVYPNMHANFWK